MLLDGDCCVGDEEEGGDVGGEDAEMELAGCVEWGEGRSRRLVATASSPFLDP